MNQKMEMTTMENLHLASRLLELEEQFLAEVNSLEAKVHTLSDALDVAKTERDELADCVSEIESQKVRSNQTTWSAVFRMRSAMLH